VTGGGKQRPNAKYKLSRPDNAKVRQEELNFYYSRENRLAKAPKHVQELYKEKKQSRFGFLGVLIADRPRKILFFSIILLCAMIWVFSFLGYFDFSYNLDGNIINVSASVYEGATVVVIKKTVKSKDAYTGAVDMAVSVPVLQPEDDFPVFYHRLFFSLDKEERYSFAVPFESPELLIALQTEKNSLNLKVSAKPID